MNQEFYLITFNNIYEVLKAEKILHNLGADIKIIPLPSKISISCGQSIQYNNNFNSLKDNVKEIEYLNIYKIKKNFFIKNIKKINI